MITPRLECILKHVTGKKVADIGTDHAYIPIRLIQDSVCERVIASDIRQGPVNAAKRHIEKYGLSDKIEVRLGGGLEVIEKGEAEQIIIAGMGGEMIIKILTESEEKAKASKLILQPMNSQYDLRRFLHKNGYKINEEDLATEGNKVYNIIIAERGEEAPFSDDFEYHIPTYLLSNPLITYLLDKKIREFKKIISGNEKAILKDKRLIDYYKKILEKTENLRSKNYESKKDN